MSVLLDSWGYYSLRFCGMRLPQRLAICLEVSEWEARPPGQGTKNNPGRVIPGDERIEKAFPGS